MVGMDILRPAAVLLVAGLLMGESVPKVSKILILKSRRTLTLMAGGQVVRTYKVALGRQPVGPKEKQGDKKTPEGLYTIDLKNDRSQFHLSLRVSYPDAADRERAAKMGVDPGGDIMIHGLPNGSGYIGAAHRAEDWTDGCVALTDEEIEEIWQLVDIGTAVEIRP
jgi:murein L,D-transpeptidase YafK